MIVPIVEISVPDDENPTHTSRDQTPDTEKELPDEGRRTGPRRPSQERQHQVERGEGIKTIEKFRPGDFSSFLRL